MSMPPELQCPEPPNTMPSLPKAAAFKLQEGYAELFQNRQFVALWIGQIFSQLADRIIFVLFIAILVQNFSSAGTYKSFLYIAFTIPAILLTAVAGVFIDRCKKEYILIASNLFRAGILACTGFIVSSNSLLTLYGAAFMVSVATQFFAPAESATIPSITPKSQLLVANSLFTTTMMASIVFGFSLGDPLITFMGLEQVHWAIVALFLLSSAALLFVSTPAPVPSSKLTAGTFVDIWEDLVDGFKYLLSQRELFNRMLKLTVLFSYVVAMGILFISYAESVIYNDPILATHKFAWLITASGIGMLFGSLVIGSFLRQVNKSLLVFSGFFIVGICFLVFAASPLIPQTPVELFSNLSPLANTRALFAHIMSGVMGIGASLVAVPLQSMVHEMIPESNRGRVMGIQFTLLSTASTLPAVIAGVGADLFGVVPIFVGMSIPLLLIGTRGFYHWLSKRGDVDASTDW